MALQCCAGWFHSNLNQLWDVVEWLSHVQLFLDPMDCILPGSSVHGILQARMLERVAISFSRGSSWPREWTCISCIVGGFFTAEPPGTQLCECMERLPFALPSSPLRPSRSVGLTPWPIEHLPTAGRFRRRGVCKPAPPLLPAVSTRLFLMSVSIPALRAGSSVPFF